MNQIYDPKFVSKKIQEKETWHNIQKEPKSEEISGGSVPFLVCVQRRTISRRAGPWLGLLVLQLQCAEVRFVPTLLSVRLLWRCGHSNILDVILRL